MNNRIVDASPLLDGARELRSELARKIAAYMGSAEDRATEIPGLTLHRRTAPTAPCSATYEPGVTIMAQGRKRVDLGRTTFIYGESRYLLTAVDLPIVSQIVEASEEAPCLAMSMKLEMPVIRELLSREEIQVIETPPDSPAMATGEVTVEFLSACGRLMDLLDTPRDIPFLSGLISTRDRLPNPSERGGRTPSSDCNARRSEPPDGKSDRLDQGELREATTGGRSRKNRGHGRLHAAPPFPGADRYESSSISEAASIAGGAGPHDRRWSRRRKCGL
jgi:hypothetical protein